MGCKYTNLDSSNFTISYSHLSGGLRFEPAEISPTIASCPGRDTCNIQAFNDGNASAIVEWQTITPQGVGKSGLPVIVPGALVPCPKVTDNDGYAFFAVKKHSAACSDLDSNPDNNFYKFGHIQPAGMSCTFTTTLAGKFNACTDSSNAGGFL